MTQVLEQNKKYIEIKEAQKKYHIELLHLQFVDLEGVLKHVTITFDQLDDALEGKIMFDGSLHTRFQPYQPIRLIP